MKVFYIFIPSFILLAIAFVLFYIHLGGVSNFFVVGIDSFRGINFLGGKGEVAGILAVALAVNVINVALTWVFVRRDKFLGYIVPFFTLFFSLLILIAVGFIISIN